ncbi:MAG: polyprenyl synthetase family protein [Desulfobacterales bacterium]
MTDLKSRILHRVKDDLAVIESELHRQLTPYLDLVSEVAGHLLFSGGKRLRPLLHVLSARLCNYEGTYGVTFSVSLEYLHAATLLHDDLIDEASLRRGKPVAHAVYGNAVTVLTGDFLLARALSLAAGTGNIDVIKVVSGITEDMSQGEIHQLSRKGDISLTEEEYNEVIRRKTAVLFRACCQTGALMAGVDTERCRALAAYGLHLGLGFQMADDLIDYVSDTATLGKAVGADLREGKLTLPIIAALRNAPSADRGRMEGIIKSNGFSSEAFETLKALLIDYGGIQYTRDKAAEHIRTARDALAVFEPSETRSVLMDIADYALVRNA